MRTRSFRILHARDDRAGHGKGEGPFEKAGRDVEHQVEEAIEGTSLGGGGGISGTHTGDTSGRGGDVSELPERPEGPGGLPGHRRKGV